MSAGELVAFGAMETHRIPAEWQPPARILFGRRQQLYTRVHPETHSLLVDVANACVVDINLAASLALWVGSRDILADPLFVAAHAGGAAPGGTR